MPRKETDPIEIHGLVDHLETSDFDKNRLWILDPELGTLMTCVNGEWLSRGEFQNRFPIHNPVNFYGGKDNPDTTKDYMY